MDLGWQLDNPAIALEKYYKDTETFIKKKLTNKVLESELSTKQKEFNFQNLELDGLKSKLVSMGSYKQGDIESYIQDAKDSAQRKINEKTREFKEKQKEITDKRNKDIQDNDIWLKNRLSQLLGDNVDVNRELTDVEKKALEFEIARRQFIIASNEKINEYEDAITEEQFSCQTILGELKSKQDAVYAKFEPDIVKYKKLIVSINKKFQPDIQACQNIVAEKIANRDEETGQLQNEKNREIQLANNEIEGYQRDYKKIEKQFNEQIRMAKLQNKPTTRMENSKVSRLNAINDRIQKINNRTNKKILSIEQKIEVAQSKHAKQIEKAESHLNTVIHNRDQELLEPTKTYNVFLQDRDSQISALQIQIDQRENECNIKVGKNNANIEAERQAQNNNNLIIDQQIIEYVMNGDTCFSDVLNEQNAPFIALQGRINVWMEMLSCIKKDKLSLEYPKEHEKQKNILSSKDFSDLQVEIAEATQYDDQLSIISKNNGILTIVGSSVTLLGSILFIVLYVVLKISDGLAGIVLVILGAALTVLTILKSKKEFSQICKYVSLASDYQEFSSITSYSTKITQDRELAKMKSMGDKMYNVHYGRTEAQNVHDAKDVDINADYTRTLKLIEKEFENNRAQIERERDNKIKQINDDAYDEEANFNSKKEDIQSHIQMLTIKTEGLDSRIRELKNEIDVNIKFIEAFESDYNIFEKQLGDKNWITPMSYTHGKLNDSLYIIPENGESDDFGHRRVYKINHRKKALIINYDISEVSDGKIEQVNKIIRDLIFDLMYAVYRMNSKETYVQFVVDEMAATNDLKNTNVRNAFNIGEVAGKIEEIRGRIKEFSLQREKLAEKGTTMDEINESKYSSQDRPETYNIFYIIYKPDERKSKLDDDIRMLIPECEKYGFLPVFICEKDTWERESKEKDSMYKDIKSLANNEIIVFDGKTYTMNF